MATHFSTALGIGLLIAALNQPSSCDSATVRGASQSVASDGRLQKETADLVSRIRRADYEGDRTALRALFDALSPAADRSDRSFASRVHYWRGFALWRRAFNGFNQTTDPKDLTADLERAVDEFDLALALDPGFADAKIAAVSCLQNLAFLRRHEPAAGGLVNRFVPLLKELSASAIENPRFLWVQGASLWYALPGLSDTQIAERRARALATYQRGLQLARTATLPSTPLEPSWGEPELLMNLGWSYLNGSTPDLKAADTHTRQALALVPHWHYVRDILLPQIEQTKAQRRLDVFVGRWKARGETYPEAYGAAAGETTGVVINRRTARDNWLLSEVTLDAVPPYGVTVVLAPKPDGSYVALAVNNMVPAALQYSGRWVDERVLELEMPAPVSGRRQRVRYTLISDDRMEFLVTESRDDGQSYPRHSSLTLSREP